MFTSFPNICSLSQRIIAGALATICLTVTYWSPSACGQVREEDDSEVIVSDEKTPEAVNIPDLADAARRAVRQTNKFRAQQGLTSLARSESLDDAARYFARYLARTGKFGHQADGQRPTDRAQDHGYEPCIVAENLANAHSTDKFTNAELAREFVQGWKDSDEHRRNLLDPDVSEIGLAVAHSTQTGYFYAVQLFGRPRFQSIDIRIANRTGTEIEYTLNDDVYWLPASLIRNHERCRPTEVTVFLSGADAGERRRTFQVGQESRFAIERDAFGQLSVKREKTIQRGSKQ